MKALLSCVLLVVTLAFPRQPITVHLAGDSTMAEKTAKRRPETGWGEYLQQYFPEDRIKVENHARGGRSTRTFISEGLWQNLVSRLQPGDFVFIQFGHNDEVPSKVDRYTPPEQYRANLIKFIGDVRSRQATPVLMTPVARRKFDSHGAAVESHQEYAAIVRAVAAEHAVAFIDMDRKSTQLLTRFGPEPSKKLFLQLAPNEHPNYPQGVTDNTHFSPAGAAAMARLAVEGVREQKLELAGHLQTDVAIGPTPPALLAIQRHAHLTAERQAEWQRYIERSDSIRKADRAALAAQLRATRKTDWLPAPTHAGFFMNDSMTSAWFATPRARQLATILVSYQAPNGGWSKRLAFEHVRKPGESYTSAGNALWLSTIDNGATIEQLHFLGEALRARNDPVLRASFLRGIEYLLNAQLPGGCWPQIYPLAGSYHDAITFNDDATISVLRVLDLLGREDHAFVPPPMRERTGAVVARGVDCLLATQVVQAGVKTVWGAQHDPIALQPVQARAYERPSLSGRESAEILDFLLRINQPSPHVTAAVHAAAAWFRATAIQGYTYGFGKELTTKEGAGPLWARFYELGTNRPIFSDRDGVVRYDLSEIGEERRYGYMWYTDEPISVLRRYETWAQRYPRP